MQIRLLCLAIVLLSGCAAGPGTSAGAAGAPPPLPDGRDLTEHPLDVLDLPQP